MEDTLRDILDQIEESRQFGKSRILRAYLDNIEGQVTELLVRILEDKVDIAAVEAAENEGMTYE